MRGSDSTKTLYKLAIEVCKTDESLNILDGDGSGPARNCYHFIFIHGHTFLSNDISEKCSRGHIEFHIFHAWHIADSCVIVLALGRPETHGFENQGNRSGYVYVSYNEFSKKPMEHRRCTR